MRNETGSKRGSAKNVIHYGLGADRFTSGQKFTSTLPSRLQGLRRAE